MTTCLMLCLTRDFTLKKKRQKTCEYAKNNTWKPIYRVTVDKDDHPDCWSSDDQKAWSEPSVR